MPPLRVSTGVEEEEGVERERVGEAEGVGLVAAIHDDCHLRVERRPRLPLTVEESGERLVHLAHPGAIPERFVHRAAFLHERPRAIEIAGDERHE